MSIRLMVGYLIGILSIGLLAFLAIPHYEFHIPQYLANKTLTNLQQQGYQWAEVKSAGRDLTITGKAPTLKAHKEAIELARGTKGVRLLSDEMTDKIISPYTLNIGLKDNQLSVAGYLPDEASQKTIMSQLREQYGEDKVSGTLEVGGGEPEQWTDLLDALLTNLPNFNMAQIDLADKQLDIAAKTPTTRQKIQLLKSLQPFEKLGYMVESRLVAADEAIRRCQERFNEIMWSSGVIFESNKSRIASQSMALLNNIVDVTQFCPDVSIGIFGHTDNVGSEASNLKLSQQRAEAVGRWLIQAGVDKEKIRAKGYGSSKPLTDNSTKAGRAKNRRIEFKVGNK